MMQEFRTHAAQLLAITSRNLSRAKVPWALALIFAAFITVALGALTFSALSYILPLATAILSSVVLHLVAVVAVHTFYTHWRDSMWRLPALISWAAFSAIAFCLALYRGLMWFEGSVWSAIALAAMEPFGIWVAGFATAMAHRNLDKYADYYRRSRDTFDACSHNPRPERSWQRRLQHVRDELNELEQPLAHYDPLAEKERQEQHAHVLHYLRLMEGFANANDVDDDIANFPERPAPALAGPAVHATPRPVPVQDPIAPEPEERVA